MLLVIFIVYPMVRAGQYSFLSWDGIGPSRFAGARNWQAIFSDPTEAQALVHVGILFVFYAVIPVAFGLCAVGLIARLRTRGLAVFRVVFFLPQVLVTVVIAILWTWLLAPSGSASLNGIAHAIGIAGPVGTPWLGNFHTALLAVGVIAVWAQFGLAFVLFLAGIQRIPTEIYDSARVDGARMVTEFIFITVPLLRREIGAAITISIVAALANFSLIYVATNGGPGTATMVPGLLVYRDAFQLGDVGGASALGIAVALLVFGLTFCIRWLLERRLN